MSILTTIHYIRRPGDTFTFCHRMVYTALRRKVIVPAENVALREGQIGRFEKLCVDCQDELKNYHFEGWMKG